MSKTVSLFKKKEPVEQRGQIYLKPSEAGTKTKTPSIVVDKKPQDIVPKGETGGWGSGGGGGGGTTPTTTFTGSVEESDIKTSMTTIRGKPFTIEEETPKSTSLIYQNKLISRESGGYFEPVGISKGQTYTFDFPTSRTKVGEKTMEKTTYAPIEKQAPSKPYGVVSAEIKATRASLEKPKGFLEKVKESPPIKFLSGEYGWQKKITTPKKTSSETLQSIETFFAKQQGHEIPYMKPFDIVAEKYLDIGESIGMKTGLDKIPILNYPVEKQSAIESTSTLFKTFVFMPPQIALTSTIERAITPKSVAFLGTAKTEGAITSADIRFISSEGRIGYAKSFSKETPLADTELSIQKTFVGGKYGRMPFVSAEKSITKQTTEMITSDLKGIKISKEMEGFRQFGTGQTSQAKVIDVLTQEGRLFKNGKLLVPPEKYAFASAGIRKGDLTLITGKTFGKRGVEEARFTGMIKDISAKETSEDFISGVTGTGTKQISKKVFGDIGGAIAKQTLRRPSITINVIKRSALTYPNIIKGVSAKQITKTKTGVALKSELASLTKQLNIPLLSTKEKSSLRDRQLSNLIFGEKSAMKQRTDLLTQQRGLQKQKIVLRSEQLLRQTARGIGFSFNIKDVMRKISLVGFYSGVKGIKRRRARTKSFEDKIIYTPDFTSQQLGITTKISRRALRRQAEKGYTGLELRGIINFIK